MSNSKENVARGQQATSLKSQNNFNSNDRLKQNLSYAEVNDMALPSLPCLLRRWLPDGKVKGGEYSSRNPKRNDRKIGSFSINIHTGKWADFATGDRGGDVISLVAYLNGTSQMQAKKALLQMFGGSHA